MACLVNFSHKYLSFERTACFSVAIGDFTVALLVLLRASCDIYGKRSIISASNLK